VTTESKLDWNSFEERHAGGSRYFVGGGGPPIVLLHGLGGLASNWRLVAPVLAEERRVIVPELPGHGGSAPLAEAESIDPFADAVLAVVEAEEAAPAPWVGHSFGAVVGLRAALLRPEAVTGLVLAAGAGISSGTRLGEATVTVLGVVRPGRVLGRRARRVSRSRLGRRVAFGWWGVADPEGFDPEMAEAFLLGPPQHTDTVSAGRALVASDTRPDLDRVRCPCLCLWGARDNWVPLKDGMEYARRLRAPLRTISDCGHLLIGERPAAVVSAVREFVADLDHEGSEAPPA
jgi:pimeloyl-ACP methyl ester carboxylesterase